MSRLALRIGAYFLLTTVAAHLLALLMVGLLRPGEGLAARRPGNRRIGCGAGVRRFPLRAGADNALGVFVDGRITAVVVLALMIGLAARGLEGQSRADVSRFLGGATALLRRLVAGVLWVGPVGVAALAAASVGEHGSAVFGPLGVYYRGRLDC